MKRFLVLLALVLAVACIALPVSADDYQTYQDIVFDGEGALLADIDSGELGDALANLGKSRMFGWKVGILTKNADVEFVSDTKLKIFNNGYSTIKHDITLVSAVETKFQISATGSIGVKAKGDVKKFDGALDASIKTEVGWTQTTTSSEKYEFMIIVDPGTYVTIVMRGQGVVSNGVARSYFLWITTKEGGWETFTVTTEYYEIVKERIR